MSLTYDDLQHIRAIVQETIRVELEPVKGSMLALENDVKELYYMVSVK